MDPVFIVTISVMLPLVSIIGYWLGVTHEHERHIRAINKTLREVNFLESSEEAMIGSVYRMNLENKS